MPAQCLPGIFALPPPSSTDNVRGKATFFSELVQANLCGSCNIDLASRRDLPYLGTKAKNNRSRLTWPTQSSLGLNAAVAPRKNPLGRKLAWNSGLGQPGPNNTQLGDVDCLAGFAHAARSHAARRKTPELK